MTENPTPSQPSNGTPPDAPQPGAAQQGTPQYGTPQYGAPQYGSPQYGPPQYGTPQYGAPQYPVAPGFPAPPLNASDERTWGMFAHLSGLLAGLLGLSFVGPLIVFLVYKDRSAFVRRHAVEALNFHITLWIIAVAGMALTLVTLGFAALILVPLFLVLMVLALVFMIMAAVAANGGREYRYPMTIRLVS